MKILLLTTHLNTGGITSYLLTLTRGLVRQGHLVWIASSGGDCLPQFESAGVSHCKVDIKVKSEIHPNIYLALPKLKALIDTHQIDIIHAQTRVTQVMGSILSGLTGRPMVSTCHGFFKPRLFRRFFPLWGTAVIAISRPVEAHLLNDFHLPKSQVALIANGIDVSSFDVADLAKRTQLRSQWRITATPLLGIIARLSGVKGIDVLLRAIPQVLNHFPQAQLMIVGEGPELEKLKALSEELGLGIHVRFDPIINRTSDVLPLFDVFVMPSQQEGLGLSVMEAQAAGVPVVVSKVGGLIDLVEESKTGFLVEPNNPSILANRIVDLLKNKALAQEMARNARLKIEANFSAKAMVDQTVAFYERILTS